MMLIHVMVTLLVVLTIGYPKLVTAESNAENEDPRKEAQIEEVVLPLVYDPSSESPLQLKDRVNLNLVGTREKTSVSASAGFLFRDFLFDVTGSGPIDEKAEEVELANLDGLASGFKYSTGVTYISYRVRPWKVAAVKDICLAYAVKRFGGVVPEGFCNSVKDTTFIEAAGVSTAEAVNYQHLFQLTSSIANKEQRLEEQKSICTRYASARFSGANAPSEFCVNPTIELFQPSPGVSEEQATEFRHKVDAAIDRGNAWFFGLKYEGNRQKFTFAEGASLEDTDEVKNGRALVASIGFLSSTDHFISVSYRNETAYSGAAKTEICSPLGSEEILQCRSIALESPSQKRNNLGIFEYRRFFGKSLAINPRFSYLTDDNILGIEIPVYFLHGKDGGLMGGFKAGWRSDNDEITVGAFIGTSLKLAN